MSEHAWSQEQTAAYVAEGLDAAEAERFEAHVRECSACASALDRARRLDRGMSSLFALARPRLDLEDRALRVLRTEPYRIPALSGVWRKCALVAAGVAAVITLGGVVGTRLESLPLPGQSWSSANSLAPDQYAFAHIPFEGVNRDIQSEKDLTNEDLGLQSNLESALPDLERVDKQTVDAVVTKDNLGQPNAPDTDINARKLPGLSANDGTPLTGLGIGGSPLTGLSSGSSSSANPSNFLGPTYANPYYQGIAGNQLSGNNNPGGLGLPLFGSTGSTGGGNMGYADPYYPPEKKVRIHIEGNTVTRDRVRMQNSTLEDSKPSAGTSSALTLPGGTTPVQTPSVVPAPGIPGANAPAGTQPAPVPIEPAGRTIVIRTGEIDYEIDSFDSAAASIAKIVKEIKGAFISDSKRDLLANGKVKGSITIRLPPEQLDGLVLDIRKELGKSGELRGSRINAQDITKQYIDLESRLKTARAMVERFTQIIKEGGKGDVKGLVEAENALGTWQTKIEEYEGELRFYANRVALSTLTIGLTEKEIRAAAGVTESERIQAGVEVEDVEKAHRQILNAVAAAKGRVTRSEMKQHSAGQFAAALNFEVAPEAAGPLRDRLRQIGRVSRLEIDRVQTPEGAVTKNAKLQRGDTIFEVALYNLTAIAPREVAVSQVAVLDVPASYHALRESVLKANGRVLLAQLNEQDQKNVTAQFDFEVRRADEAAIRATLDGLGEVLTRQVSRTAEGDNVTDAKVMFRTSIIAVNQLKPREKITLGLEVADVDQTAVVFGVEAAEVKGRQIDAQFTHDRAGRRTAKVVYEVPLAAAAGLAERFKSTGASAGAVRLYQSTRERLRPGGKVCHGPPGSVADERRPHRRRRRGSVAAGQERSIQ